jgi:polyisoprenoid-binding protein YceI
MKKILLSAALLTGVAALTAFSPALHVDTYKVDAAASKLEWTGEKVTGKHYGTINIQSGTISNNHGSIGGAIIFDMKSIVVTDLTGEYKGKLEGHLRSDDFFSVEKHPTATFEITGLTPLAGATATGNNFNVNGKLTIKGVSHPLTFPANVRFDGPKMTATGEAKVNRTLYDIKYRSASFVEDIGDKAIADDFLLKLSIVANK